MHVSTFAIAVGLLSTTTSAASSYLRATALVTNAQNHSQLECWQFTTPLNISAAAGTSGAATFAFPASTESIYTLIPGRFNGGTHNAPAPQLVVFLSGLAHITLPVPVHGNSSLDEAWVLGGADGLVIAADTLGSGHITTYPLDEPTASLQIPFASVDEMPAHEVVGNGPCRFSSGDAQVVMGGGYQ
ncbi:hypothetical protein B0A54_03616 [Friedmanniomyces endolithicus]|uniref:Small secreted protein n=1 Tax=Friedmanniomyces endolithicus TaxID=329885 RepID=A0A4U0VAI2_9PEZI|nr:hypothetical protein LTS09_004157 [Friedmanniomyces endolithicus]KAK1062573.1 hypothetical protein LTR74_010153 [Friedmanniomyces endolithicus]TKA45931.1 hypothetical protein B0A54_03616 [Friedmanniomyces endolithicus]